MFRKGKWEIPNKPEERVIDIIKDFGLPYRYVGREGLTVNGLYPDFIHSNGEKKIVEIFGRVYHDPEEAFWEIQYKRTKSGRKKIYSEAGYDTLILWDDELEELSDQEIADIIKSF